jgi:hemerythrin-like domain-containing protein
MSPTFDIKGEHAAITIILRAMKKMASDMRQGRFIDSYRIVQILDFLHTYTENCHYEKEEKCLFPALLAYNVPWTVETLDHLSQENAKAHVHINEIDALFEEYLTGNSLVINKLAHSMITYAELEENHIKIIDNVVLPLCDKLFDSKKLKSISAEFRKIQDKHVSQQKYLEYYKLLAMLYAENDVMNESVYL